MKVSVFGLRGFPLIEGGVEKHCEQLYPLIDNDICITVYRRKSYVKDESSYKGISFIDLPNIRFKGIETLLHSYMSTKDVVKKHPDIAHIHNIGSAFFCGRLKRQGIQVVLTYHSPNYEHDKWSVIAKLFLRLCEKIAFKYADKIIFVNKFQMEKFSNKIREKSVYIPNGIRIPEKPTEIDYLNNIGVKPGKYILGVGRITQEKGFDTLIKAYKRAEIENYKLVIAGGVEFENEYMDKLRALSSDNVIFTGYIYGERLAQIYANAALFVLASNNEGFPLVLLEAMSYNLKVLVSDIPACHLVELDKDDYFEKGNTKELGDKIIQKLKADSREIYDLKKFDWAIIAKEVSDIYREVSR